MKVIILAGGRGTRLPESAKDIPKALVPIDGKPILKHQIDLFEKHRFSDIRLALGYKADQIIEYLGGRYEYLVEQKPLGTGGALKFASRDLFEPFIAVNGDIISNLDLTDFVKNYKNGTNSIAVSYQRKNTDFGFLQIDRHKKIKKFLEKPAKPKNGYVSVGFYILDPKIFREFNDEVFSLEYDIFPILAKQKLLNSFKHRGFWIDVGTETRKTITESFENARITIFSVPEAFLGHRGIIQKNAITSWSLLHKDAEILLFGNAPGVRECAEVIPRARHIPTVRKNARGTPYVRDIFSQATMEARHDLLCYASSDIILTSHFMEAVKRLPKQKQFIMVARQKDVAVNKPIEFDQNWEQKLTQKARDEGKMGSASGMHIMVFPKHLPIPQNNLLIERPGWDNAFVYQTMRKGIPIINATLAAFPIHQKHEETKYKEEAAHNISEAGGLSRMITINNAHVIFATQGIVKLPLVRQLYADILLWYPVRKLLGVKRNIDRFLDIFLSR